jgi:hypothetical protein
MTALVAAALISAVATAPIAAGVAYFNHTEAVMRIKNERLQHADVAAIARERLLADSRQARCTAALGYLQDETPNAALPPAEAQLLLSDMRRTASTCALPATDVQLPAGGVRK